MLCSRVLCPSETELQDWLEGECSAELRHLRISHVDSCAECTELLGALHAVQPAHDTRPESDALGSRAAAAAADAEARPLPAPANLEAIGRYWPRRLLGVGGMGVVYEAYDPALERLVALKLLRAPMQSDLQERLRTEAQAMAKLEHPNVLAVHDVGSHAGRIYLVMPLVRGSSLREWLQRPGRTRTQLLHVLLAAGRGLASAHQAGLVHRDFKPDNVLIREDNQVLVSDFGLAVSRQQLASTQAAEGTFAYMAPEQRAGSSVDARSDQFAYAIVVRQALERSGISRALHLVLTRAAAEDPQARYPSMHELLAAIEATAARARRWRRALFAIAATLVLGGTMFSVGSLRARPAADCHAYAARAQATWNPAVAARIRARILAIDSPLAKSLAAQANELLTHYAQQWATQRVEVCEVQNREARPSELENIERERACLDNRLERLVAVTELLESSDAELLEHAQSLLEYLAPVAGCRDARADAQLPPPPAAIANEIFEIRRQLGSANAHSAAARYAVAATLARQAAARAQMLQFLPAEAEALLAEGIAEGRLGHALESRDCLERAALAAALANEPAVSIQAWIQLMHFAGVEARDYPAGDRWNTYARAGLLNVALHQDAEGDRRLWARALLVEQGRLAEAQTASAEEWAYASTTLGAAHRLYPAALDGKASLLAAQCRARDALTPQAAACAAYRDQLGPAHPQLALCLNNLASIYSTIGEHQESLVQKRAALAALSGFAGHDGKISMLHRNLARSELELHQFALAEADLAHAERHAKSQFEHTAVALLRVDAARRQGQLLAARTQLAALAPTDERQIREALVLECQIAMQENRLADARRALERLATQAAAALGAGSCKLLPMAQMQAELHIRQRTPEHAKPIAEAAMVTLETLQVDPLLRARMQITLAASLPSTEAARARNLIASARSTPLEAPRQLELELLIAELIEVR